MIDWQDLLQQLDWDDATRQERALKNRLKERARQYAQPKELRNDEELADLIHVVTFLLGEEMCALDVRAVRGVRSIEKITRVPSVPPFYRGVVNVRGKVISALDLRTFFNLGGVSSTKEALIVEAGGLSLAILADRVDDVTSIPRAEIEPVDLRYAYGVTRNRITVLDIEQIVADERLIVGGKNIL